MTAEQIYGPRGLQADAGRPRAHENISELHRNAQIDRKDNPPKHVIDCMSNNHVNHVHHFLGLP